MQEGFVKFPAYNKNGLKYIGDQKPFQNIDPRITKFTSDYLPNSRYIHIIRHPANVISSCLNFGRNNDGGFMWKGLSPEEILAKWVLVEQWVSKEKSKNLNNIIDIRYEDITSNPDKSIYSIFKYLELELSQAKLKEISATYELNNKPGVSGLSYSKDALEIMKKYNYHIK